MDLLSTITRESERCVACGLCLPHCPTYRKTQNEAESPRGRIALMRTLATGDLALTPNLVAHLDRCLACRACERVCPSNVGYGDLIRAARAVILERQPALLRTRWRERITRHLLAPEAGGVLRRFLRFYQQSGLRSLARASGLLKLIGLSSLDNELPPLSPMGPRRGARAKDGAVAPSREAPWQALYPARGVKRGSVALFTGCVSSLADRPTLDAAIRVLNRVGYDVHVPAGQACCGALHQHSGEAGQAQALALRNLAAFGAERLDAIVGVATGCTATLAEYGRDLGTDTATRFSGRVTDIAAFLTDIAAATDLPLKPLPKRIAVQDSCTATNVLRNADKVYALLGKIPGAEVQPLPENTVCCGAAGAYHLRQPEMAERLRADKIAHIKRLAPDILVSSNVGCSLFLAAGLREAGCNIEVLHPVALLARQLQD